MKKNHKDITKKISSGAAACLLGCTFVMAPMSVGAEEVEPIMGMERTIESSLKTGFKGVSFKGIGNNKVLLSGILKNADKEKFKIYFCEKTEVKDEARDLNLDDESDRYKIIKEVVSEQYEGDIEFWLHLDQHDEENIKDDAEYALLAKDNKNAEIIVSDDVDGDKLKELFKVSINKTNLEDAIAKAEKVKNSIEYKNAKEEFRTAYDKAIEKGEGVIANKDATQVEIDQALEEIIKAEKALDGRVSKLDLKKLVEDEKKVHNTNEYKQASEELKGAYDSAIKTGKEVLANKAATQEDVEKAIKDIETAKNNLKDVVTVDKSELKTLVDGKGTIISSESYSYASKEKRDAYDLAIEIGSRIFAKEDATQRQVNKAIARIKDAIGKLDGKKDMANKAALLNEVEKAKEVRKTPAYKNGSKEKRTAYDNAIKKGQEVLDKKYTTQVEIDSALEEILEAEKALDGKEVDLTVLEKLVSDQKTVHDSSEYQNSKKEFRDAYDTAIKEGKELLEKDSTTQEQVEKAIKDIETAKNNLKDVVTVNKIKLKELIDGKGTIISSEEYSYASKEKRDAYDLAIENGSKILNKEDATQKEVDDEVAKINEAIGKLDGKKDMANKAALLNEVEKAKEIKKLPVYKNGSKEKRTAYDKAIEKGNNVLNKKDATQVEIDQALEEIIKAEKELDGIKIAELKELVSNQENVKASPEYKHAKKEKQDVYDKAIKAGEALLADENTTQKDVDDAVKKIKEAWDALSNEITINKVIEGDENITIKLAGETKGEKIVLTVYGKEVEPDSVDVEGNTVEMDVPKLEKGDKLKAQLIDANGEVIDTSFAIAQAKPVKPGGGGGGGSSSGGGSYNSSIDRIDGTDRIDTAVQISKKLYPNGTENIVIANANKFSDVLTATPFAVQKNAAILFVEKDNIPEKTLKEIERLNAKNIYISGGKNSVSEKIENTLNAKTIKRLSGEDRYDTAKVIADEVRKNGNKEVVEIASGENFPDALSISTLAVKENAPILLVKKDNLTTPAKEALESWKNEVKTINLAGEEAAISADTKKDMSEISKFSINRYGGRDRYQTSAKIAKIARPDAKLGVVASGEQYADALVAGPYAAKHRSPILLTQKEELPTSTLDYIKGSKIKDVSIVGGEDSVSKIVYDKIKETIK